MLHRPDHWHGVVRFALGLVLAVGFTARQAAEAQLPGATTTPRTGLTREELTRSWDLDGDGTISKSEAEVAKARMKRERIELQLGETDPLTGMPRSPDDAPIEEHTPGDEPEFRLPPEDPLLPSSRGPGAGLPGMRSPSLAPPPIRAPIPSTGLGNVPTPSVPRIDPSRPGSTASGTGSAAGRSTGASWLTPGGRGSAVTGGVRAGAPAASQGYGSGPWSDLNAARYRYAPAPVNLPRTGAAGLGASGLGTAPRRTGSILLPGGGMSGQMGSGYPGMMPSVGRPTTPLPSVSQPMAPPPPVVQPPRISAEEIGGY
ncbi:MAG: hypothetical protein RLZZ440_1504 [Planctomycetota bacterium]